MLSLLTVRDIPITFIGYAGIACGNGVIEALEEWDDNDTSSGDGCSSSWQIENKWDCTYALGALSVCTDQWADGYVMTPTTGYWDDGNTTPNDGCDVSCNVENKWTCSGGDPTTVSTWIDNCGDGFVTTPQLLGTEMMEIY